MVAARDLATAPEQTGSPTAEASSAPDAESAPMEESDAGQNHLPSDHGEETTPDADAAATAGADVAAEESEETDSSSGAATDSAAGGAGDEGTDPADEARLPKGVQQRIDKLTAQKYAALEAAEQAKAEAERLKQELEDAQLRGQAGKGETVVPEPVAKLKTVAEVEAEMERVNGDIDSLTDFLDRHPGEPDAEFSVGNQTFTRQQLIDRRAELRTVARALPKQARAITEAAQFKAAREAEHRKLVTEFPEWNDEKHPDVKTARQLLRLPQFQREPNGEYLALAIATGDRVLKEKLAARSGKGAQVLKKPVGKVAPAKPHAAAGVAATPASSGKVNLKAVLERHQKDKSKDSFAALLSATGR